MRNLIKKLFVALGSICLLATAAQAQTYTLEQTAIAGGGMSGGAGGTYNLSSTTGQSAAVNDLRGTPFSISGGFWAPAIFAPTSANVSLGGRIMTADGAGIRNVHLMLMGGSLSTPRVTQTGTFGFFRFNDLPAGETYILTINSQRFVFAQPTVIVNLTNDLTDLNFTSEP